MCPHARTHARTHIICRGARSADYVVTFDYPGDEQWLCLNCLEEGESFFTQDERATLADVSERTQQRSDNYEKAGLGPEIP